MKLAISILLLGASGFGQAQKSATPEDLIKQVVLATSARDEKALSQLAISKEEFKKYVWPNILSLVSGNNMTADKFYEMYQGSSQVGIKNDLETLGGAKWEVIKVAPGAIQKKAKDYTLFLAPEVVVRDSNGQQKTIHPVGGLLERAGEFKVTTYFTRTN